MPDYTMHVVSHTHWDREWYLPFQLFRIRLVDLIDHLIDILESDPEYKFFTLDGQTIILEDYLEIKPEKRAVIERLVREGRLVIGPWYVLNDEFLVSGESTIRSLLIGHRLARQFGPVMKVGYLPDQFGNISQAPQILLGFGIDNAIFGRGLRLTGDRKMEFWWESPDGSRVLASLMAFWYNNAQRFPVKTEDAVRYVTEIRDAMKNVSHVEHLLLMNGVDHIEPQPELPAIMSRVNKRLDGDRLIHSTLPAYIEAVKESVRRNGSRLDTIQGELREDHFGSVLAGTLSSRMYLKQANEECQTALEKYAEPAASFAYILGAEYPQGLLNYAWKLLLQNHPHDSICGCSVDQVHEEMEPRFEQVKQIAREVTDRALTYIANRIKTEADSLVVFNFLNWARTDKVRAVVDFEAGPRTRGEPTVDPKSVVETIRLTDPNGKEVPIAIISSFLTSKQVLDPNDLPHAVMVKRFVFEFLAEGVPGCGYRVYRMEKGGPADAAVESPASEIYLDNSLTNEFLRVTVRGATVNVELLDGPEAWFGNLNLFEDVGDVGDEYCHVRPRNNLTVTSLTANPDVFLIDRGPVSATVQIDTKLKIPARSDPAKSGRSQETVECPITTYLTLTKGVPRVDVVTLVDNRARDHRLRVLFPTGIETDTSWAEGQFDVIGRPLHRPSDWDGASPFHPQQRWVDVNDGERGLCIINKGLPEYELYADTGRTIALTLLRCVGTLSGGGNAPGASPTPGAQCLRTHRFEYAIYPHAGDWEKAQVWKQAHQHNIPLVAVQTGAHDGDLPPEHRFLQTHSEVIVSAVKKAEDSDLLVVRIYNVTSKEIEDVSIRCQAAESAKLLNLNEEPVGDVVFSNATAWPIVGPKKIVTIGFGLARQAAP